MILNRNALKNLGGDNQSYLKLWLTCNGDLKDKSGNSNDFTNSSGVYYSTKTGYKCIHFSSTSYYARAADSNDWYFPSGTAHTIMGWVRFIGSDRKFAIFGTATDANNYYYVGSYDGTTINAKTATSGSITGYYYQSMPTLTTGEWYHIAFTTTNDNTSNYTALYINSVPTTITASTTFNGTVNASGYLYLNDCAYGTYRGTCSYKDIMVFKGIALTKEQIQAIYDATYIA